MPPAARERALGPPRPPKVPLPLADPDLCPGKSCRQSAFLVLRVTLNYCPQGRHGNPGIYRLWSEGRRTEARAWSVGGTSAFNPHGWLLPPGQDTQLPTSGAPRLMREQTARQTRQ